MLVGEIFMGCLASFRLSQAVLIQTVFTNIEKSCYAQCLVSADAPHNIEELNTTFALKFGAARDDILGKQLPLIVSPDNGSKARDWSSLVLAAVDGSVRRCQVSAIHAQAKFDNALHSNATFDNTPFTPFEEAIFVPVVEALNGKLGHILVIFQPFMLPAPVPQSFLSSICPPMRTRPFDDCIALFHEARSPPSEAANVTSLSPTPILHTIDPEWHIPGLPQSPEVLTIGDSAIVTPPFAGDTCPTPLEDNRSSLPRRWILNSSGGLTVETTTVASVVFTPALLYSLRGRPLPAAARCVGVSVTAFKLACRRLGIRRWAFARGPARKWAQREAAGAPP